MQLRPQSPLNNVHTYIIHVHMNLLYNSVNRSEMQLNNTDDKAVAVRSTTWP